MAEAVPDFRELQYRFAAHLRDPAAYPPVAGIEDRRLKIYRDLFFNNVDNLLSIGFPVIKRLLGEQRWLKLLRRFYAEHQSHTPLFTEIGREFNRYLETRAARGEDDPPFLPELGHYEWVELALTIDEHDIDAIAHDPHGDLAQGAPLVSPLAWALQYRFPVHRIRHEFQPESPADQPTLLVVVRNRQDRIGFTELNPLSFQLLQLLKDNPGVSGLDLVGALVDAVIASGADASARDALVDGALATLQGFKDRDIVLGTLLEPN